MSKTVPKRLFAWLLAAMVALIVAPSAAFADDLTAGHLSAQDGDTVFTVYNKTLNGKTNVAKAFTQAELNALAEKNATPAKYMFMGSGKLTVAVATKYVTFDQLANEAGVKVADGDFINAATAGDFSGPSNSYANVKAGVFCPSYNTGEKSTANAESTPGVLALEWGSAEAADATVTTGSLVQSATAAAKSSGLRNFWGYTVDNIAGDNMPGKPFVKNANELYFEEAFGIYARTGSGAKTLVKSYTAAQLNSMATTAKDPANAPGFLFNKNGWQVGTTTKYIPIKDLLSNAGVSLKDGDVLQASASDGFTTTLSFDQVENAKNFYPATTPSDIDASAVEECGAVLGLNWATTPFGPKGSQIELTTTAGEAKANMFAVADTFEQQTRVFVGLTSPTDTNTGGNRFATGPVEFSITTVKDISDPTVTVSGVDASYTYTGEAIEPKAVVKDGDTTLSEVSKKGVGDYSVEYMNNTALGTGKVIITGKNAYKGTKTIEFKITAIDISKATVAAADGTYTGKALTPAPTVKLGDTTLKEGTDYTVSYANNTNAGTATVTVTGKGIYAGTATGTFEIAKAASSISIAKQSKVFTNKAIAYSGKVTKAGSTGAVTYKYYSDAKCTKAVKAANVKKAGTYYVKAVLAGDSNYKAATSAAVKLTVKKAANKVTAKKTSVSKSFNAAKKTGKLAKTKKVALPKVTAKFGTAKWKVSAKDKKGVLTLKSGKVVVKKGANKGTYTIKLRASVAKTANYKAASTQVVKVTVKVK